MEQYIACVLAADSAYFTKIPRSIGKFCPRCEVRWIWIYPLASTSRLHRPASAKRAGSSGNELFCSFMFYYKLLRLYLVQMPMQMDLKPGGDELIRKVSDMTKKYGREHLTVWGAFSHRTTTRCREHNPNM